MTVLENLQAEALAVSDQILSQNYGVYRKDGHTFVGAQLTKCQKKAVMPHEARTMTNEKRLALKKKPLTAPSQPFGTICGR